ncbi:hypothetical protein HO173_012062 [Letharia columbiana]|uniref:Uncharacterized protein n=1 Tax=Letharia columbiana TaxID=112416 RepID=A0A8H6CQH1_9LECA|nr:uncharacterized protein HO173_012062 [Letharia columbiana]KAF6227732.1 hypothetical protein HO173_012062 [Letharia columbiana]
MAATRLRETFQYPADNSDDDDTPKNLDEEEQEKLIAKLRVEDDERNEEYKRIFLAVPSVSAMAYIPTLIMSSLVQAKLVSLLCITSLTATAYILAFVPITRHKSLNRVKSKKRLEPMSGPVHQYISYLNGTLSLLCALNSIIFRDKQGVHDGFWLLCLLPVVSFAFIILARRLMLSVDVDELEILKYGYKGA